MKRTYDSFLKLIYCLGLEKRLLSEKVRKEIPRSTASTWRSVKLEDIINLEYSDEIRKKIMHFADHENQLKSREKQLFRVAMQFRIVMRKILGEKEILEMLKENKPYIVHWVEEASKYIDLKVILKLLGIKISAYYQWRSEIKYFCLSSPMYICSRTFPFQLTSKEVSVIKKLLTNPETLHWSIASIHGNAFKRKQLNISRPTLYRYNKYFGFRKKQKLGKKPKYKPIRASRPNEIWHADISVFVTDDGKRQYIYAVIDNYSRKILEWDISGSSNAQMSKRVLKRAIKSCKIGDLQYITDAGTENTNLTIKEYLNKHHASIAHKIALRDIRQSNSMIESVFRVMKSTYLYLHKIKNRKQLFKVLGNFVYEYNELKPHYSQQYYTPSEIYGDHTGYVNVKRLYKEATAQRFKDNKGCSCTVCILDKEKNDLG